jgi:hypothetical protein
MLIQQVSNSVITCSRVKHLNWRLNVTARNVQDVLLNGKTQ